MQVSKSRLNSKAYFNIRVWDSAFDANPLTGLCRRNKMKSTKDS